MYIFQQAIDFATSRGILLFTWLLLTPHSRVFHLTTAVSTGDLFPRLLLLTYPEHSTQNAHNITMCVRQSNGPWKELIQAKQYRSLTYILLLITDQPIYFNPIFLAWKKKKRKEKRKIASPTTVLGLMAFHLNHSLFQCFFAINNILGFQSYRIIWHEVSWG